MRFTFNHPAVVTGTWDNGDVRRELVRVGADFEIAEYSSAEAPLSFTVRNRSSQETSSSIRTVASGHHKKWTRDEPSCGFGSDAVLMQSIYTGNHLAFKAIRDLVYDEVRRVYSAVDYRGIQNTDRKLLKREIKEGLDSLSVSCMKAPMLRNWQWLGSDVENEVASWRQNIADLFARIILVDGVPYTRCFEPCYGVFHADTIGRINQANDLIRTSTTAIYSEEPDRVSYDTQTGLNIMKREAFVLGSHFFAATDYDDAVRFIQESGGIANGEIKNEIIVHDPSAVMTDFLEMETVRHARIVHDRAQKLVHALQRDEDGVCFYNGQEVDAEIMCSQIKNMETALVTWQEDKIGIDALSAPFEELLEHVLHWSDSQWVNSSYDLEAQMDAFKLREDMSPVTVPAFAGATPGA
jgi:hypothetical protein